MLSKESILWLWLIVICKYVNRVLMYEKSCVTKRVASGVDSRAPAVPCRISAD